MATDEEKKQLQLEQVLQVGVFVRPVVCPVSYTRMPYVTPVSHVSRCACVLCTAALYTLILNTVHTHFPPYTHSASKATTKS
jgi:hypothetical protein